MAWGNSVTVVGNVTRDPELRFSNNGMAVTRFGLAWNKRNRQGEEKTSFFDVVCFGEMAENVSESLSRGARVLVTGELSQDSWQNDQGDKRSKVEIIADEVGPSLKWATAEVQKTERRDGGGRESGAARTDGYDERDSGGGSGGGGRGSDFDAGEEPF